MKFLEYLANDRAQVCFADGNNEWPVVPGVRVDNPALAQPGPFKADTQSVGVLAQHQAEALKIFDRVGCR